MPLGRPLRLHERAALQGFPAILGQLPFDEVTGRRIWGNAMSVPVLGSILAQELICLQDSLSSQRLQQAIGQPVGELGQTDPETRGWEAGYSADEQGLVMPGLRAATVAWAANISKQWGKGTPGRASRPPWSATPADNIVLRKRKRQGKASSSSSGLAAPGHLHRPAGQPLQPSADTPSILKGNGEDIQRVGNKDIESDDEDTPFLDFAS